MDKLISSKDNPNIKLYQKLAASKKYRTEYKMFTLEGLRLITDAVNENAELHCVFLTESFSKKHSVHGDALDFLIGKLRNKVMYISDELGNKLASTEGTQGIFAICRIPSSPRLSDIIRPNGKYIVLHNIQDPGNMGTIIRTADAMGVDSIISIRSCDIYNPKTVRSTMGSLFRTKICLSDEDECFEMFSKHNITSYAAVIDKNAISLTDCNFYGGSAVFIGNEGSGLPDDVAARCSEKLTIHMHGNVNSLNAATAAAIIMWELTK